MSGDLPTLALPGAAGGRPADDAANPQAATNSDDRNLNTLRRPPPSIADIYCRRSTVFGPVAKKPTPGG